MMRKAGLIFLFVILFFELFRFSDLTEDVVQSIQGMTLISSVIGVPGVSWPLPELKWPLVDFKPWPPGDTYFQNLWRQYTKMLGNFVPLPSPNETFLTTFTVRLATY